MAQLKDTTINGDLTVTGKIVGGIYDIGDSFNITYPGGGYVTAAGTSFQFAVPIPPVTDRVTGFEFTGLAVCVRQNGQYVLGSSSTVLDLLDQGVLNVNLYASALRINYIAPSAPSNVTNNDGFGFVINVSGKFI